MPDQNNSEKPMPLFGPNRYVLDRKKAIRDGYRIFRAVHSCGCCHVEMAFLTVHNARLQFDMPKFADTVRDDMGVVHECVNTMRGFTEIKLRKPTAAVAKQALPVVPRSTVAPEAQLSSPA